jgi:RimJ/RimL family protein N-acetyltransferase
MSIYTILKRASDFPDEKIVQFKNILMDAGEVESIAFNGLIAKNPFISFYPNDKEIGSIGALKIPNENYKLRVFSESKTELQPYDYDFELGWIVSVKKKKGFGKKITQLLSNYPSSIYATVRKENVIMSKILLSCGFKLTGKPFQSSRGNYEICLYVKSYASQQSI